jgi:hypothetical protein
MGPPHTSTPTHTSTQCTQDTQQLQAGMADDTGTQTHDLSRTSLTDCMGGFVCLTCAWCAMPACACSLVERWTNARCRPLSRQILINIRMFAVTHLHTYKTHTL